MYNNKFKDENVFINYFSNKTIIYIQYNYSVLSIKKRKEIYFQCVFRDFIVQLN
jgi:hypothetical protein